MVMKKEMTTTIPGDIAFLLFNQLEFKSKTSELFKNTIVSKIDATDNNVNTRKEISDHVTRKDKNNCEMKSAKNAVDLS